MTEAVTGRYWSYDGLCREVNEVSRQTFLTVLGVRMVGGPLESEASTMSEAIEELALDDWRCGFRGPKVVITYEYIAISQTEYFQLAEFI